MGQEIVVGSLPLYLARVFIPAMPHFSTTLSENSE